jgi:type II secretory ATPase GspE/PulE/Tfp pilus assembly ATPase PilB-like protein
VEYDLQDAVQVEVKPEIGLTFAEGLKRFLRHDPDVIMVGEIRDPETARIAVRAALTGHLVLSTMHTNDSVSAIDRLRDMGIDDYMLDTVRLVIAQRLVRKWVPADSRYSGRTALFEMLPLDAETSRLIRSLPAAEARERLKTRGFRDLKSRASELMEQGILTRDEFVRILGCGPED